MAYELIFYGNGPIMNDVIAAVNYVLNSPDYSTLLQLVLMLAGLLMLKGWHSDHLRGGLAGHGLMVGMFFVATMYYGAYSPKATLVIQDPLNSYNSSVKNVPLGTALVIWTSNRITNGFATLFDKGFTSSSFPDEFNYNNTGGTPTSIVAVTTLGHITPSSSYLLMSVIKYLHDCWTAAAQLGLVDYDVIYQSGDVLTDMQVALPDGWTTTYYDSSHPTGETLKCNDAYTQINNAVNADASATGGTVANLLSQFKQLGVSGLSVPADASNMLQAAAHYELNAGYNSQKLVAQAMLVNSLNPALQSFASSHGLDSEALGAALTESALQTTTTMTTSYALASVFLPMSFLVVNSFVYAIFPLLFALMFVPALTRKYGTMAFDLFMWIAFWGPIASIIQYIVQAYGAYSFQNGLNGSGISYATMPYLMSHGQTLMTIAGDMMFSVPVIAFAVASGSAYAMTAVAGNVAGLSKAAARGASVNMATDRGAMNQVVDARNMEIAGKQEEKGYLPSDVMMGNADAAASHNVAMMKWIKSAGFSNAVTGSLNSAMKSTGEGVGLGNTGKAFRTGKVMGQSSVGGASGMLNAARDQNTTVENLMSKQTEFANVEKFARSQAGQSLANEFYGGNIAAMENEIENVEMSKKVGGARGESESYEAAKAYGFKGSLGQYEAYQQKIHSESLFGQNLATQKVGDTTGAGVIGSTEMTRYGSGMKAYAQNRPIANLTNAGVHALFDSENKKFQYDLNKGVNLAPTAKDAGNKGAWDGKVEFGTFNDDKSIYRTPQNQADMTQAQQAMRMFSPLVQNALTSDDKGITRSMNAQLAPAMEHLGKKGAEYESYMMTDEELKLLSSNLKSLTETDRGRHMTAELAASMAVKTDTGFQFMGNGIKVSANTRGQLEEKIDNALKTSKGFDAGINIMRQSLQQKNYDLATSNPDNAFIKQKEFYDNLRSAIQSGDINKAANLLGIGNEKQNLTNEYYKGASPGRIVNDAYQDIKGSAKQYMNDLKNILESYNSKEETQKAQKKLDDVTSEFNKFGND